MTNSQELVLKTWSELKEKIIKSQANHQAQLAQIYLGVLPPLPGPPTPLDRIVTFTEVLTEVQRVSALRNELQWQLNKKDDDQGPTIEEVD